jgi:uncharacterized protein (TIGR03643 family)
MLVNKYHLNAQEISRVIEMAWEDRTPFEAIKNQFGLSESEVIVLMRKNIKTSSFKLWRKRVQGRNSKHQKIRHPEMSRFHCPTQYKHR